MIEISATGGVTALSVPEHDEVSGGITFRVGYADEILAQLGTTHLIEHLALHHLGVGDAHFGGTTGPSFTTFATRGSADDVRVFIQQICEGLTHLPMNRIGVEKEILRTEAAGRTTAVGDELRLWRYGARGQGLAAYPEWGLHSVEPEGLQLWVERYFTLENAVMWFSGMEPPADLSLELPHGRRRPEPTCMDVLPTTPSFFVEESRHLGFHARVPRTSAGLVYSHTLAGRLHRRMRHDHGLSYTIAVEHTALADGRSDVVAVTDVTKGMEAAALGEFIDTLATLEWSEIPAVELETIRSQIRSALTGPHAEVHRLPSACSDLLRGVQIIGTGDLVASLEEVTQQDVTLIAEQAAADALLRTPYGQTAEWAGFSPAPVTSDRTVGGTAAPGINNDDLAVVIGDEGVSVIHGGAPLTVTYQDCQVMLAWPDGRRVLIGGDGTGAEVEPRLVDLPPKALAQLDSAVPPQRIVHLPARDPDQLPTPPRVEPVVRRRSCWHIGAIVALSLWLVVILPWTLTLTFTLPTPQGNVGVAVAAVVTWVLSVVPGVGIWLLIRDLRRH